MKQHAPVSLRGRLLVPPEAPSHLGNVLNQELAVNAHVGISGRGNRGLSGIASHSTLGHTGNLSRATLSMLLAGRYGVGTTRGFLYRDRGIVVV
jgi:hypothetical protein